MSVIIQKTLFEKLSRHPEWRKFRKTCEVLTECRVELVEKRTRRPKTGQISVNIDVRGIQVGSLVARLNGESVHRGAEDPPALRHLLSMAAERFSSILAESHIHDHERLPASVLQTCRWIRERALTHEVRLGEAAGACGLSASHLSRLFHRSTGMTFQEYVTRFRLERACEMLATTNKSVTTIAFDSGFQSISQFHRSFRAVYSERPLDFRRRQTALAL